MMYKLSYDIFTWQHCVNQSHRQLSFGSRMTALINKKRELAVTLALLKFVLEPF